MRCDHLRFHLAGGSHNALTLYQWLSQHLDKLYLHINQYRFTLPPTVAFVGFEKEESLLPSAGEHLDGYRILQEFLWFPERFYGFCIEGLSAYWPDEAAAHIQLEFRFNAPLPPDLLIDQTTILLNCIPAINLFSCSAQPMPLNGQALRETIQTARRDAAQDEIFCIDRVSSQRQKTREHLREFKPYDSLDPSFPLAEAQPTPYYKLDLEQNPITEKVEHRLRLVHRNLTPYLAQQEALSIELTCTNGALAQQLEVGHIDVTTQDTPSFVTYRNLSRPSRTYPPLLQSGGQGERHWALISNLTLNNLSLSSPSAFASVRSVVIERSGVGVPLTTCSSRGRSFP